MDPGTPQTQNNPNAHDAAQLCAVNALTEMTAAKAEGLSILNYGLANNRFIDALSIGKLLGVDTSRLRPYGGESNNTVNVIGADAMDALTRHTQAATQQAAPAAAAVPHATSTTGTAQPPPATNGKWKALRNAAIGASLLIGGAGIPSLIDAFKDDKPQDQVETIEQAVKDGRVEVDVY